ncbi:MAG TPA: hypothetical protein VFV02_13550 [Acidimicrobiales bacterium]|nr:hypothetical protein [Acidimicrobiales bacterium]
MSDRTTRSSTRSKAGTGQSNGKRARGRDHEQLGDLEFSDWYESRVFEPSSEERFEEMATSGRAPARLLARVVIAAGAKRERIRGSRDEPAGLLEEKGEPVNRSVEDLVAQSADDGTGPAENPGEETALIEPEAPAEPIAILDEEPVELVDETDAEALDEELPEPADETDAETLDEEPLEEEPLELVDATPAEDLEEEPEIAGEPAAEETAEAQPVVIEPGAPEPLLIPELADRVSLRKRVSALLDRWADKEVAMATKLDEALVPTIPWGSRKKPAHARRSKSG